MASVDGGARCGRRPATARPAAPSVRLLRSARGRDDDGGRDVASASRRVLHRRPRRACRRSPPSSPTLAAELTDDATRAPVRRGLASPRPSAGTRAGPPVPPRPPGPACTRSIADRTSALAGTLSAAVAAYVAEDAWLAGPSAPAGRRDDRAARGTAPRLHAVAAWDVATGPRGRSTALAATIDGLPTWRARLEGVQRALESGECWSGPAARSAVGRARRGLGGGLGRRSRHRGVAGRPTSGWSLEAATRAGARRAGAVASAARRPAAPDPPAAAADAALRHARPRRGRGRRGRRGRWPASASGTPSPPPTSQDLLAHVAPHGAGPGARRPATARTRRGGAAWWAGLSGGAAAAR